MVSMTLFIPESDFSALYVHVSRLAWHTQDMLQDPRVALSIAETDDGRPDPFTLARVMEVALASRDQHEVVTVFGEHPRESGADAGRSPGDDRYSACFGRTFVHLSSAPGRAPVPKR